MRRSAKDTETSSLVLGAGCAVRDTILKFKPRPRQRVLARRVLHQLIDQAVIDLDAVALGGLAHDAGATVLARTGSKQFQLLLRRHELPS